MLKDIIEIRSIGNILHKKGIYKQYIKAKNNILSGNIGKTYFKEKKPKGSGIWYFRINRQYRALGFIEDNIMKIYDIDNHQN